MIASHSGAASFTCQMQIMVPIATPLFVLHPFDPVCLIIVSTSIALWRSFHTLQQSRPSRRFRPPTRNVRWPIGPPLPSCHQAIYFPQSPHRHKSIPRPSSLPRRVSPTSALFSSFHHPIPLTFTPLPSPHPPPSITIPKLRTIQHSTPTTAQSNLRPSPLSFLTPNCPNAHHLAPYADIQ
jgi:hypothetical protein